MNLVLRINGRWFYKKPGVTRVDLLPAFWEKPLDGAQEITMELFAPPADGMNHEGDADWDVNYRCTLPVLPTLRLRWEGCVADPG